MSARSTSPIGIFDSGVGGLSVLRAVREQMPEETVIYLGDQGHIPYGPRPMAQIRDFSEAITRFLLERDAKLVVVACNTASAAALKVLREKFPYIPFVGMEPAVKPAAERTQTGRVGVLATPATFQGALYASVVERFANGVELFQNTCNGLVQQIEQGNLDGEETSRILEEALLPMLERNIDTVVLGCTHYPFVLEAGAVKNPEVGRGKVRFYTSGDPAAFQSLLPVLLGEDGRVEKVEWLNDSILAARE
jgi:glutamate racemase